ncbi:MAG: ABC transporter permease, partial [Chloroflexi bacterium]|nr:ABC transporter permease [Chloroflexota bacterium]
MLTFHIARRFIWRSRLQSALIISGIAVGIGTQVFVGSLIASLQASLIDTTVGSSAHVTLEPASGGKRLVLTDALASRLADDPAITAVVPQQRLSMLALTEGGTDPLIVRVADAQARDGIYGLDQRMVAGRSDPGSGELLVGLDYAEDAGLIAGDELVLVTEAGEELTVSVAGIFDLGVAALNAATAFAGPELAASVSDREPDEFDLIEIQVADVFSSASVLATFSDLDGVTAVDWQEQNRELLTGLQSQSISSIMIQVFVVVAVGLGIASTLA